MDVQTTFVESSLMTLIEFGVREGHKMKGFLQTIFIFSAVLATGKFTLLLYHSPNLKVGVQQQFVG